MTRAAEPEAWSGVVLAGGRSRRMGRDKAMLLLDGETLLDRARRLLGASGCQDIWVSGRPEERDGIADSQPGQGPAHAILDALKRASAMGRKGVMVIPVDMPALSTSELRPLMAGMTGEGCAWKDQFLPLALSAGAPLPKTDEVWSVRGLLEAWDMTWLVPGPAQTPRFANLNTPDDLEAFSQAT